MSWQVSNLFELGVYSWVLEGIGDLIIKRTSSSPAKVEIRFSLAFHPNICTKSEWDSCDIGEACGAHCVDWDQLMHLEHRQDKIKLDFTKAPLANGEETIGIDIGIREDNSLFISPTLGTATIYRVKYGGNQLKFIRK
jgi:hypothetical protein